jgi:predicted nucleic acid-binding protein
MAEYYIDSSALVKRHVNEAGSNWLRVLIDPGSNNLIITSRLSMVEVFSAFSRRLREGTIQVNDYRDIADDFARACVTEYEITDLTDEVVNEAKRLLESHPLRASDAVHLASALLVNRVLHRTGLAPLTFLASDMRLLASAQQEGLATDDPALHP